MPARGMGGEQPTQAEGGGQKVDEDARRALKTRCLPAGPARSLHSGTITQFPTGMEPGEKLPSGELNPVPARPPPNTQKGS